MLELLTRKLREKGKSLQVHDRYFSNIQQKHFQCKARREIEHRRGLADSFEQTH